MLFQLYIRRYIGLKDSVKAELNQKLGAVNLVKTNSRLKSKGPGANNEEIGENPTIRKQ